MILDTNTCAVLAEAVGLRAIALYSHLVPAVIAVFLGWYAVTRTKYSKPSIAFLFFTIAVALWLIADVVLWTVPDYDLVAFIWSWIDFVNVVFFVLAAYFFGVLARGEISRTEKILLIALCIPAFIFTVTGNSVTAFDHTWCEMLNNDNAVSYKSFVEWACILLMIMSLVIARKQSDKKRTGALGAVFFSLVLFLATFSITELIAAQTAVYEVNLFGLFALPVFLMVMAFAINNLGVFKIRYLGTQVLIYVLILLIASQLLFLESSTDAALSLITLGISVCISVVLIQNEKREMESTVEIEELAEKLSGANTRLQKLDRLKSQFLSFASHQLKAPMTSVKWTSSLIAEGSLGKVPDKVVEAARGMENTAGQLMRLVDEFLNLRKLEEGRMSYEIEPADVAAMVSEIVHQLEPAAQHKGLALTLSLNARQVWVMADRQLLSQVVMNLVDNAIKYTETGSVTVVTSNEDDRNVMVSVSDTGHGMDAALLTDVFDEFNRDRTESRIEGTGLGLYIAKQIVGAHHGKIWAQSPGRGKGSTFHVTLPITEQHP